MSLADQDGIISPYNNIPDTFIHNLAHDFYPSGEVMKLCEAMDPLLYRVPYDESTGE